MGQGQFSEGKAAWHSSHPYGQTLPSSQAAWHGACWKNIPAKPSDIVCERGGWVGPGPARIWDRAVHLGTGMIPEEDSAPCPCPAGFV